MTATVPTGKTVVHFLHPEASEELHRQRPGLPPAAATAFEAFSEAVFAEGERSSLTLDTMNWVGMGIATGKIKLKRAYEPADAADGTRVLIDRLWPRGLSKDAAAVDLWLKEIAPSTELRKWFGHEPARWDEFQVRYADEVHQHPDAFERLRDLTGQGPVTLVYSAHDLEHNDAIVLRDLLLASRRPG